MACCNLYVLNPIVGCPYDCTYCFLQAYQNEPFITLYANLEDLEHEVRALHALNRGKCVRICTGELADSLALAPLDDAAAYLIGRLCRIPGVLLELKTKSTRIEHLLELDHRERAVISWSLNPGPVAALEERGAPGPKARLAAAAVVAGAGYPTAFHFDPIIRIEGWKAAYTRLLGDLFRSVPASAIRWISLGGFRYTPEMKARILDRFPETRLFLDEFLRCPDGKYRYYAGHRIELYRTMVEGIRRFAHDVPVYLCMEAEFVWRKVFGTLPGEARELEPLFGPRDG
jgi:spore photoproduct lyase